MHQPEPIVTSPSPSLIARLTTNRRLLLALGLILCITVGAQVRAVAQRDGLFYRGGEVPIGSDFTAFYSAGRILAEGDGEQLYDLDRQQATQARVLGRAEGEYDKLQPFAYPAFVAAPYALLAKIPFLGAYLLTTALMLGATIAAVLILRPVSPTVHDEPLPVGLALLASQPLLATSFGGQTVGISLLCLAAAYAALRREQDIGAGIWLGLLLYKPPLAVLLLALLLWRRRWRAVTTAAAVGGALGLAGVVVAGPSWPWRFLDLAGGSFYEGDA